MYIFFLGSWKNTAKCNLFNQNQIWIKAKNANSVNPLYDITMVRRHRAEICELVVYSKKLKCKNIDIYRDAGIFAIYKKNMPGNYET